MDASTLFRVADRVPGLLLAAGAAAPAATAQSLHWQRAGSAALDEFGAAVAAAGDVDGDGSSDVIVGAWRNDAAGSEAGAAYVFAGLDGALLLELHGIAAGDRFGQAVAGAGDVDGDGLDDVAVGAPEHDGNGANAGAVFVHSGADGSRLATLHGLAGERFGWSIARLGDLDGDGISELLVGAPRNAADRGRACIVSASGGSPRLVFWGEATGDWFGGAVALLGDADGDGAADVAIGAHRHDLGGIDRGRVYVFSTRDGALLGAVDGEAPGDGFGAAVAAAGDVDGDGRADLLTGAPFNDRAGSSSGCAYVHAVEGALLLRAFPGLAPGDQLGAAVADLGDLDCDGMRDHALGATGHDAGSGDAGLVSVRGGRDGAELFALHGIAVGERLGTAVAGAGDVDGSGCPDVVVGASYNAANGTRTGRVAVHRSDYAARIEPQLAAVAPARGRFDAATAIVLTGQHLATDAAPRIRIGGLEAGEVVIVDDGQVTCTVPPGDAGPVDVSFENRFGASSLPAGFAWTPALFVEGSPAPGAALAFRVACERGEAILGFIGLPPRVAIDLPPLAGRLQVLPFHVIFLELATGDEVRHDTCVPDDPALSGLTFLVQAAAKRRGRGPRGSFTNCVELTID